MSMKPEEVRDRLSGIAADIVRMKPIPPWDWPFDSTWLKVDKRIKKLLDEMLREDVKRPMSRLQELAWEMAMEDIADHGLETDVGIQTLAWRAFDTRLLLDESRRLRAIIASDEPWNLTRPTLGLVPPAVEALTEDPYLGSAQDLVEVVSDMLRERRVMKPRSEEEEKPCRLVLSFGT